jgi:hypothetical protein
MTDLPQSAEDYRELVSVLEDATAIIASVADDDADLYGVQLQQGLRSLQAVLHFLLSDPAMRPLVRPLAYLHSALHDTTRGADPALFDQHPEATRLKPTGIVQEYVQGHLAFALELLVKGGMGKNRALPWLVAEMARRGLRTKAGDPIKSRQIDSWRTDISRRKGPAKAIEQFEILRENYKPWVNAPASDLKQKSLQGSASNIVLNLANLAPRDAPSTITPREK